MKDFEELLATYRGSAEAYVRYRVSSREDAEDILQETYVQAFSSFLSLNSEEAFKPWLVSIARNKVNDYYRQKNRIQEVPLDESCAGYVSINRTVSPQVSEAFANLNENDRSILYMYYWDDMTVREIAEKLRIAEGTVKSRLHAARQNFAKKYPGKEKTTMIIPKKMPEYTIRKIDEKPFEVQCRELLGWFMVPEVGNRTSFGLYDFPERTLTEQIDMKCVGQAEIHGLKGVKIETVEKEGRERMSRTFIAQLTDTHVRYLAETHVEDGVEKTFTFMDGNAFLDNWGFGPDNVGMEIDLKERGLIQKDGDSVTVNADREVMDIVGRYEVTISGKKYDTVCLMDIGSYDENTISEQYIDRNGRTVLWRRFNKKNWRWNFDHHEQILDEKLMNNEKIIVNGEVCYHWYDCITDYVCD